MIKNVITKSIVTVKSCWLLQAFVLAFELLRPEFFPDCLPLCWVLFLGPAAGLLALFLTVGLGGATGWLIVDKLTDPSVDCLLIRTCQNTKRYRPSTVTLGDKVDIIYVLYTILNQCYYTTVCVNNSVGKYIVWQCPCRRKLIPGLDDELFSQPCHKR